MSDLYLNLNNIFSAWNILLQGWKVPTTVWCVYFHRHGVYARKVNWISYVNATENEEHLFICPLLIAILAKPFSDRPTSQNCSHDSIVKWLGKAKTDTICFARLSLFSMRLREERSLQGQDSFAHGIVHNRLSFMCSLKYPLCSSRGHLCFFRVPSDWISSAVNARCWFILTMAQARVVDP